jgi:hypothetical protein
MTYDVLLLQRNQKYIARVRQWPDVMAEDDTEAGALALVEARLQDFFKQVKIVQLDITPPHNLHPWAKWAGVFDDDDDWDEFQADVDTYRQDVDNIEAQV